MFASKREKKLKELIISIRSTYSKFECETDSWRENRKTSFLAWWIKGIETWIDQGLYYLELEKDTVIVCNLSLNQVTL